MTRKEHLAKIQKSLDALCDALNEAFKEDVCCEIRFIKIDVMGRPVAVIGTIEQRVSIEDTDTYPESEDFS